MHVHEKDKEKERERAAKATRWRGLALPVVIIDESKAKSFPGVGTHNRLATLRANFLREEKFYCRDAARATRLIYCSGYLHVRRDRDK